MNRRRISAAPVLLRRFAIVLSQVARGEHRRFSALLFLLQFGNPAAGDDGPKDGDAPDNSAAYGVAVYNVTTREWQRERAAPAIPMFAQCAAVGTRLAVMGGWDPETFEPVSDVHVLDATTGVWRRGMPMRSARSFFACAEAGGKIYVAGGHDKLKNALKTAEAYDAVADGWDPLPYMSEERDECDGMAAVAGDRFMAVSGYRTGRQGGFERDAEWIDPATREWRRLERVRAPPSTAHVVVRGRVWCLDTLVYARCDSSQYGEVELGPSVQLRREEDRRRHAKRGAACCRSLAIW